MQEGQKKNKTENKFVTQTCVLYQGNSPRWIYVTLVQIKGKLLSKCSLCSPGRILASPVPGWLSWRLEGVFSCLLSPGNPSEEASWGKWYTSVAYITFPIFRSQIRFGHCFHYQHRKASERLPSQIHQDMCHSSLRTVTRAVGMQAAAPSISSISASGLLQIKNILSINGALLHAELSVIFISQAV